MNVQNYGNDNVRVEQNGTDIDIIIGSVANDIMQGGRVAKSIQRTYGSSRAGGAY